MCIRDRLTSKVEGKVLCNFGFIHHPRLTAMLPEEKRIFITDYACDCYEFSDSGSLCSHCTALAMEAFGDGELVYEQKTNLPGGELSDGDLPEDEMCIRDRPRTATSARRSSTFCTASTSITAA